MWLCVRIVYSTNDALNFYMGRVTDETASEQYQHAILKL